MKLKRLSGGPNRGSKSGPTSGPNTARGLQGFTLVELMVGLAVGLFVAVAAISIFVSTRTLQTVSSSGTRMSENSRLAMDLLNKDLRSAGFLGCRSRIADVPVNLLVAGNSRFLDTANNLAGIRGSRGDGGAFLPALNATLAALAPNANSDFLSVRVPVEPLSLGLSVPMTSASGTPQVFAAVPGNNLVSGAIVLIANCKAGAVFQVTEADPKATGALAHAQGGGFDPGNVAGGDLGHTFRGDTAVYRLQTNHYYIAPGTHAGTNSMWRLSFPNPDNPLIPPVAEEAVQGIDRMVVSYGLDSSGTQTVGKYVTADAVTSWDEVMAVRVQLLSSTVRDGVALSAQSASFAGSTVVATDRRLRTQVTQVVTLRSRAP